MKLSLEQKLGLELRLHPQMLLTLKLLPMTTLELETLLRHELEENPALEEVTDQDAEAQVDPFGAGEPEAGEGAFVSDPAPPESEKLISETEEGPEVGSRETSEFLDLLDFEDQHASARTGSGGESDTDFMELAPDVGPGLAETLMPGLAADLDEEDTRIAEIVLQSLDADGFLTVSAQELADAHELDPERLGAVLDRVRHIEPGGIACCDRREALLVQLEMLGHPPDSLEHRLVAEFWSLLLQLQFGRIAALVETSEAAVRRAAECVHGLEMRPARRFAGRTADYVTPDFTVTWQNGRPYWEYNDDREPRLRLSRRYADMLRYPDRYSSEQVTFARQKFNRALMYLKAIESRRQTLRGLIAAIVQLQPGFFEHGPEHMRTATFRDAAGIIGVHPSTASRAGAGKYVETDFGIFPVKYFFRGGAGERSRVGIKELIRGMVEKESPHQPLCDDEIAARLETQHNVKMSRRTVTKYRRELGIPARNQRFQPKVRRRRTDVKRKPAARPKAGPGRTTRS
ncbi:MAG TPA: RNA polymerase sigma-54 factor [candidate division WOR-3 bacterium]|uniref:RNA polymerase sigma-54 factor n=1 Tax=candidate division WOR-3 bacterium TaxID=2052148 RepID=A0A7V0T7T2_UNCW3|nr:RNA polymerase sigma-54 factor [candidate division WOR-3 bacterium]